MPGFLKVDGSQKPIAVPWLKESGTWKPVAIGYIKVDGTWRIWYTAEVVDDFNRADNADLGTASDDFSEWTELTSGWSIENNSAKQDGSAGPSIASVQMYKASTDVIVEADLVDGTGLGVAFWVNDANNWWAAIPGRRTQNNASFYSCPPDFQLEGNQCRKVETYTASYEADRFANETTRTESYNCCPSNRAFESSCGCCYWSDSAASSSTSTSYTCPSGYSGPSPTNRCSRSRYPVYSTSTTNLGCVRAAACGGSCTGICDYVNGEYFCSCVQTTQTCTCGPDGVGSCPSCPGNHIVFATATTSTSYSCPTSPSSGCSRVSGPTSVGGTQVCRTRTCDSFDTCTRTITACPSGYSSCSSNCNGFDCVDRGRGYYCPQGGTRSGTTCTKTTIQNAEFTDSFTTYPPVVRIYKRAGGVITQEFQSDVGDDPLTIEEYIGNVSNDASTVQEYIVETNLDATDIKNAYTSAVGTDPASIQVETVGNTIRYKSFSSPQADGSPYDSLSFRPNSANRATSAGIAKYNNQVVNQATRLDNFRAE